MEVEYAKLSDRFYAFIIDLGLLILPLYIAYVATWNIIYIISENFFHEIYTIMQTAIAAPAIYPALVIIYTIQVIAVFLLLVLYHTVCEVRMNGQSIGKIIMSIKVISENSGKINYKKAFIRNFLRILDFPGFILIAKTKKKQKPGDIFAGTVVVVDK